jgi:hypothetical protein
VSVARFIADQRTMHRVPHAVSCGILGVSLSWFHKWINRRPTPRQARRADLDTAVKDAFDASKATYGSRRIHADLVEAGWTVSVNTVADSMRRQGLQGRKPKRRRGLTRQDRSAPKFPANVDALATARACAAVSGAERRATERIVATMAEDLGSIPQIPSGGIQNGPVGSGESSHQRSSGGRVLVMSVPITGRSTRRWPPDCRTVSP